MQKKLRQLGYLAIGIFVLLLFISFLLPSTMEVERTQRIEAPTSVVFQQIYDLRNWEHWAPWRKMDPTMQVTYSNPPTGNGAFFVWDSDRKRVGSGKLTLVETVPQRRIIASFDYEKWKGGDMVFVLESVGENETDLTWSATNEIGMNPFTKYYVLLSFKSEAKRMFSKGLKDLKTYCEAAN